ncbi:MAG: hypothetical protein OEZ22_13705 [Spirochaetia bacterium]|nr:hypothetical protein [Spirochaetia bacterium]
MDYIKNILNFKVLFSIILINSLSPENNNMEQLFKELNIKKIKNVKTIIMHSIDASTSGPYGLQIFNK